MAQEQAAPAPRAEDAGATDFPAPQAQLAPQMPVDVRNVSLVVLAILASLFVLHWASEVFIPVMLSVLLSYALSPLVNWLEARRLPRWLGSAALLLAIVGGIGSTAYALRLEAAQLIDALPAAAKKLGQAVKVHGSKSDSALETVQKAATQIEQAARGATRVVIEAPRFNITDYLWSGTMGLVALIGQTTVVIFLTHFERQASGFSPRSERSGRDGLSLKNASAMLRCQDLIGIACKTAVAAF